ncbi:hypothetical protein [Streptomyces chartreusis]|uniref:hypothetical protein n=1 Tax=Streptomyces chartreusis TaxID=1969 RepID=UPI0036A558F2
MKKQSAHERYREAEQTWKDALHEPFNPIPPGARVPTDFLRLHEAAYAPIAAGRSLDEWAKEALFSRSYGEVTSSSLQSV